MLRATENLISMQIPSLPKQHPHLQPLLHHGRRVRVRLHAKWRKEGENQGFISASGRAESFKFAAKAGGVIGCDLIAIFGKFDLDEVDKSVAAVYE
jgi:hypothetical protein